jgi:hypothetical protein
MSFLHSAVNRFDPVGSFLQKKDPVNLATWDLFKPKTPPPAPGVPNPNDAQNAAQSQTDALRMRRGLMANIYAGASNTAPVSGKTQLGT